MNRSQETHSAPNPFVGLLLDEIESLKMARFYLERPSMATRLTQLIGQPIESAMEQLPQSWRGRIQKVSQKALFSALELAVFSLDNIEPKQSKDALHKIAAGATGALGGAFGLLSLGIELPVSTALMLRSIADIARSEGHDLSRIETRLGCLEVFALGGSRSEEDATESAYWTTRAALAGAISQAASFIARQGVMAEGSPAIVRLLAAIGSRFGIVITQGAAVRAVPIIGAIGGGTINLLFMKHFQEIARGHFIVKRLEKRHGPEIVKAAYKALEE
jgi:hypothetical protein